MKHCRWTLHSIYYTGSSKLVKWGVILDTACVWAGVLCVFPPPYRVGWLSVWACPGPWRSIWSESHLSDCKWTACPRDARQLSGLPRKWHVERRGSAVQQDETSCATISLMLQVCCIAAAIRYFHMWVKRLWLWIIYVWTDGESEIKESGPWLQNISCGINAYISESFYITHLLNVEKSGTGLVISFRSARRNVL